MTADSAPPLATPWMKPREAAAYCRISLRVLYESIRRGDCRAARVGRGRAIVVHREWLDQFLSQRAEALRPVELRRHAG